MTYGMGFATNSMNIPALVGKVCDFYPLSATHSYLCRGVILTAQQELIQRGLNFGAKDPNEWIQFIMNSTATRLDPLLLIKILIQHYSSEEDEAPSRATYQVIRQKGRIGWERCLRVQLPRPCPVTHRQPWSNTRMKTCHCTGREDEARRLSGVDRSFMQIKRHSSPLSFSSNCNRTGAGGVGWGQLLCQLYPAGTGIARTGLALQAELH